MLTYGIGGVTGSAWHDAMLEELLASSSGARRYSIYLLY
jgi:hypothetical protein